MNEMKVCTKCKRELPGDVFKTNDKKEFLRFVAEL